MIKIQTKKHNVIHILLNKQIPYMYVCIYVGTHVHSLDDS